MGGITSTCSSRTTSGGGTVNTTATKSIRDGVIVGTAATLWAIYGPKLGISETEVTVLTPVVVMVVAAAYRAIRNRWPWLGELDPGASSQG